MQNYKLEAEVVGIHAPRALNSGDVVSLGKLVGVATTAAASGALVQVLIEGAVSVARAAGVTLTEGQTVLFDEPSQTVTVAGATKLGYCITPVSPDNPQNAWVKLTPMS